MIQRLAATLMGLVLTTAAHAGIVFQDNFDTENGGVAQLNYDDFINWDVSNGTVDLIGSGSEFDFLPGNGLYVDLDGSSGDAGLMGSFQSLSPGNYRLSFDLAGNQRNDAEEFTTASVAIVMGDGASANETFSLSKFDPFQTFHLGFVVNDLIDPALIFITFGAAGGDNVGMLLDNVVLSTVAVPEPGTLSLLGLALLGLGAAQRRRSRA